MKEEQIRDEMGKVSQRVIELAKQSRLPIYGLGITSKAIEEELKGPISFLGPTIRLINDIKRKIKNSNLPEHSKKLAISQLERFRGQYHSLLRQLNSPSNESKGEAE